MQDERLPIPAMGEPAGDAEPELAGRPAGVDQPERADQPSRPGRELADRPDVPGPQEVGARLVDDREAPGILRDEDLSVESLDRRKDLVLEGRILAVEPVPEPAQHLTLVAPEDLFPKLDRDRVGHGAVHDLAHLR